MEVSLVTMEPHGTSWVKIVPPDDIDHYASHLMAVLERDRSLWEPFHTVYEVLDLLRNDLFQLWVGWVDSVQMYAITEVAVTSKVKTVTVVWCGGYNVASYLSKFFLGIEEYAKIIEADYIFIHGRPAWAKLLKPYGYEFTQISLRKAVDATETTLERNADDAAGTLPGTAGAGEHCDGADPAGQSESSGYAVRTGVRSGSDSEPGGGAS